LTQNPGSLANRDPDTLERRTPHAPEPEPRLCRIPDLLIDGQWCDAADGRTLAVVNPAHGKEIGRVAHAGRADLDRALAAAQKGFDVWRAVPAIERGKIMRQAAQLLRERDADIAALMTQEQGKPLIEAKGEITMCLRGDRMVRPKKRRRVYGRVVPARNLLAQQLVLKDPVGPVAAFTPWNFPINQVVRRLPAALATGCSIIVKAPGGSAGLAGRAVTRLCRCRCAGWRDRPALWRSGGDLQRYLIPHPVIRKVTFTGSTPVGKQLAAMAGQHMKRVTMELAPCAGHSGRGCRCRTGRQGGRRGEIPQRRSGVHFAHALSCAQQPAQGLHRGHGATG
jgi:succinate-semialdehyde dehydrogenase/glutarate-semialdehyde dehydrogenase